MDRGSMTVVSIGTTATPLVGANPQRRRLTVSSNATNPIWISDNPAMTSGQGLLLANNAKPLNLDYDAIGDWVQKNLFAVATGGASTIAFVEVICPCQEPPLA